MTIRQFIDQLAAGENVLAKETLENIISSKAFEALDAYKREMAAGIFGGQPEEVETEEEVEEQEVE